MLKPRGIIDMVRSSFALRLPNALGLVAGVWFSLVAAAADLSRLDQLLQAGDTVALVQELRSGQYPASELLPWLRRQAEAGHVLLQYELAERLKSERLDEALEWYAKGRLARLLDEEECNRAGKMNAAVLGGLLDFGYRNFDEIARKNEPLFAKGMQAALAAEGRGSRISAAWICGGEANLLPRPEAQAARAKARERLERRRHQIASEVAASRLPLNPSGFRIVEPPESSTGYIGNPGLFVWLDNERLLIVAPDRQLSKTELKDGRTIFIEPRFTLHIWDVGSGKVARYRSDEVRGDMCYADGHVRYLAVRDGQRLVFEGPFGAERPRPETPPRVVNADHQLWTHVNPFTCKEYWYLEQPRPNGGRPLPLRQEHGVLESRGWDRARNRPDSSEFFPPFGRWLHNEGKSLELDFPPQEQIGLPIHYSKLVQAYLFRRPESRIERGMVNKLYLFFPRTLIVRSLEIPGDVRWHSLHHASVTKTGLVAASRAINVRADWDPGEAGLYLFFGSAVEEFLGFPAAVESPGDGAQSARIAVERLNRGTIEHLAVSPDGCRVAVKVDSWDGTPRRIRLEMIDLCARGR